MSETMLDFAFEFLTEKKEATFKDIFEYVSLKKMEKWVKLTPNKTKKQINDSKAGELFTLLTISGRFVKIDDKFGLTRNYTHEEVRKMKINVSEELV